MNVKVVSLEEKLNKFKLTHRSLNLVRAKDLHELDLLIESLVEEGCYDEVIMMIGNFLEESPKIYLAHYCLAITHYLNQSSGDVDLKFFAEELIKANQKKLAISVFRKILNYYESSYLVKTLVAWLAKDVSKNAKNVRTSQAADELVELRKKILKQYPKDIDTSIKIAEYYENTDVGQAVNYYQMSFLKSFEYNEVERILSLWNKLIKLNSDAYDFYLSWSKKLVLKLESDKPKIFIPLIKQELVKQENQNLDYIIQLFKIALQHGIFLAEVSPEVLKVYLRKYKDHSFLNDFLKFFSLSRILEDPQKSKLDASERQPKVSPTNLMTKSPSKVLTVLDDFEKKIQFDIGRVVRHASFGIGKVQSIIAEKTGRQSEVTSARLDGFKLVIDFVRKKQHQMSFRIAVNSLTVLSDEHLMAIKYFDKEKFQGLVSGSPNLLLIKVLESISKPVSSKEIFSFIEKYVLSADELAKNLSIYKKVLKSPDFYFDGKTYQIKDRSVSFEAVTVDKLTKTNLLANQIKIIDFYFSNQEKMAVKEGVAEGKGNSVVREIKQIVEALKVTKPFISQYLIYYICDVFKLDRKLLTDEGKLDLKEVDEEVLEMYRLASSQPMRAKLLEFVHSILVKDFPRLVKLLLATEDFDDKEAVSQFLIKNDFSLAVEMSLVAKENLNSQLEQYVLFARSYLLEGRALFESSSKGEVIQNLIRFLHQAHINIERDKSAIYYRRVFSLIQKILFNEHIIEDSLALENDELSLETKRSICSELIQLSFLENYLRLEILKLEEKLKS